ncbi:MAG: 30S ribosomal protein S20 [Sulfurifustaceae bacterium]
MRDISVMPPVSAVDASNLRVVNVQPLEKSDADHTASHRRLHETAVGRLTKSPRIRIVARLRGSSERQPVANTAQAKKRARQAEKHRAHNAARRSLMRTEIKKALSAIASKDKSGAQEAYRRAASIIDRLAGKGIIHRNTASRYKSRLNSRLRTVASA